MSATMKDNPLHTEGKSKRRKIVGDFEINYGRCIVCGICVDVCNFDAIEMSQEHELSVFARNDNRADLSRLLQLGYEYQENTGWSPTEKDQEGENVKT
jgi:formate hydrogenlyase subunit 6/NADH:ubiquinone oxidoreductase subunit I